MLANPDETYLSAAVKLNIHRKRVARLLQVIDALPDDFIERAKECTDPAVLRRMSVSRLLKTSSKEQISSIWT